MDNFFCVVQVLILCAPLVQCACHANNELHFFKIDLFEDYEKQMGDGWTVSLTSGDWTYHDAWPGLDGAGIFEINSNAGTGQSQWFELDAFFSDYDQPEHYFEFELKFYNEYLATLQDVIDDDGDYEETIYLDESTQLQWSIIKFYREGGPFLPPNLPRLMVKIPSNSEVFLMEYLSTRICDSSVPAPTTTTTTPAPTVPTDSPTGTTHTPTVPTDSPTGTTHTPTIPSGTTTEQGEKHHLGWIWKWDPLAIILVTLNAFLIVSASIISYIYCCSVPKQGGVSKFQGERQDSNLKF